MKDYELLEAQARMMRMAEKYGVDDWRKLVNVSNYEDTCYVDLSTRPRECDREIAPWQFRKFALGVVEGKPVFYGDILYDASGIAYTVSVPRESECKWNKDEPILYGERNGTTYYCQLKNAISFSWNPPKPKTVMVEMSYELAEYCSKLNVSISPSVVSDVAQACRKAIEEKK